MQSPTTSLKIAVRKARRLVRCALGKDLYVKRDLKLATSRVGSEYGGWELVIDWVDATTVIYSFGVGEDLSFDLELIEMIGAQIHIFDPTPRSVEWVLSQDLPPELIFHPYGIADLDGKATFTPPKNPLHISHTLLPGTLGSGPPVTLPVKSLSTIAKELGHSHVDVLKMDIEGAEYMVIDDIEASDIRPRQILVEFHHRFKSVGTAPTQRAIESLRKMGYRVFWISPSGEEYGFALSQ